MPDSSDQMQAGDDEALSPEIIDIPLLPEGSFEHPWYGELKWTPEVLQQTAENFQSGVLGISPCLNFDHCATGETRAAGWIEDVYHVPGVGLEAKVKLNRAGREAIGGREYRYISAEFAKDLTRADGRSYRNVIVGAALTNTPFHDSMRGVFSKNGEGATVYKFSASDSRSYWVAGQSARKGTSMLLEYTRRLLGLRSEAPEDEVAVTLAQRLPSGPVPVSEPATPPVAAENPDSIRLARENEALSAQLRELNTRIESERAAARLAEAEAEVTRFTAAGIIPPAVRDQAAALACANREAFSAVFSAMQPVPGVAPLSGNPTKGAGQSDTGDLHALALAVQKRDGSSYFQAMKTVLSENPAAAAEFERQRSNLRGSR